jgi:hypothetical protein
MFHSSSNRKVLLVTKAASCQSRRGSIVEPARKRMGRGGVIRDIGPRLAFAVTGVAGIALAGMLLSGARWTAALWPVAYQSRLAPIFLSSVLAAVGASSLYIALRADWRTARPAGLALLAAGLTAIGAFTLIPELTGLPFTRRMLFGAAAGAGLGAVLALNSGRYSPRETRRMPPFASVSFAVFGLTLLATGLGLVLRMPNVFPWRLDSVTSVLYGAIFTGLAFNYLYGAIFGTVEDARVSLIGFLVYDIVLLPPFIALLGDVPPARMMSLTVYTGVLVYSALLALYCLLVDPRCRLRWTTLTRETGRGAVQT